MWRFKLIIGLFLVILPVAQAQVVTRVLTSKKVVALTFDGCENRHASYLDCGIIDYLVQNKIPATFFLTGKFAYRNMTDLRKIKNYPFFEFENHSLNHIQHMEKLSTYKFYKDIAKNQKMIRWITGKTPKYFRFPGGNYDDNTLKAVESMGLQVVHWTYASGDPDKNISSEMLAKEVDSLTTPGDILIFHVNGRGAHTAEALPKLVEDLRKQGYTFVTVDQLMKMEDKTAAILPKQNAPKN